MTYNDETLRERYHREHAEHLARLAKLTPEQIEEMAVGHHNAIAAADSLRADLLAALEDMLAGWKYIRESHGDLYGVGWDRAQDKATAAIARARGEV